MMLVLAYVIYLIKPMNYCFSAKNIGLVRNRSYLFQAIEVQLQSGEILIVEGRNGCGKSSLLRILASLLTPSAGEIFWQDQKITCGHENFLANLHYLGHANGIKLNLTVMENLVLMGHLHSQINTQKIPGLLRQLGLQHAKETLAKHLSAGQKRKLALAKLSLYPKPLWILDEPFDTLDSEATDFFHQLMLEHLEQRGVIILSTHQPLRHFNWPIKRLRLC